MTGASVTNKGRFYGGHTDNAILIIITGIYYEAGKEPPPEGPPKLHLLIESNEEYRVSVLAWHCFHHDTISVYKG
jgi:ATP-dependent RNA helicase DDX46/PRP5